MVSSLPVRTHPVVKVHGDFELLDEPNEDVFAFKRTLDSSLAVIVLNFTVKDVEFEIPKGADRSNTDRLRLLVSNSQTSAMESEISPGHTLRLSGYEARIYMSGNSGTGGVCVAG